MPIGDRIAIAAVATAMVAIAICAWMLVAPAAAPGATSADPYGLLSEAPAPSGVIEPSGELVIDVEGGVLRPGIVRLPGGSRVADAIAAAGGFSPTADLVAAAVQINLAELVHDGQQVLVPLRGNEAPGASNDPAASGGLVDLNHASPEELDALPGIGPVTVQKIVAARAEQLFGTLDELVERKVLTSAQLDKIRDLVTVG